MRHLQFNETAKQGQAYIFLEDAHVVENPRLVVGKIKVHGSARDPTPKCVSGFPCSDGFSNPFEYGHIMAWELGGPNVPENIVPQYAEWQGSPSVHLESWRNMEIQIGNLVGGRSNQFIYVAVIEYRNNGNNYQLQVNQFSAWKQLFDWNDYRIPTDFHVYVEPAETVFGGRLCAEFLTKGGLGAGHIALCNEILSGAYSGTPEYGKYWDHSRLPPQDQERLLGNMTACAVEDAWQLHEQQKAMDIGKGKEELEAAGVASADALDYAAVPLSPSHDDAYTYCHDYPDEVRDMLVDEYGLDPSMATNVTVPGMVDGYYHGGPLKRDVKAITQRRAKAQQKKNAARRKALSDKLFANSKRGKDWAEKMRALDKEKNT